MPFLIDHIDNPRTYDIDNEKLYSQAFHLAGTVLYQLIRNHERFIGQLAKARAEFAEKKGTSQISDAPHAQQQNASARVYHIDGTPANESSHGILIQDNQKFVRKR